MSIPAINWAIDCPGSPTQKHVLIVLANFADDYGLAWPSTNLLVRATGLTDRSIRNAKKQLKEMGLISDAPERGTSGLRLNLEVTRSEAEPLSVKVERGSTNDRKDVPLPRKDVPPPRKEIPPINNNHHLTTNNRQVPPIAPHPPSRPKSKPKQTFPDPPDWVDREAWFGWLEMRRRKGAPATDHALALTLKKLAAWRDDGHDVAEILNTSTERGWTGVFEPRPRGNVVQLRPQFEAPPARSGNPFDGFYERFVGEEPPPFVESSEEEKRILRAAGIIGGV